MNDSITRGDPTRRGRKHVAPPQMVALLAVVGVAVAACKLPSAPDAELDIGVVQGFFDDDPNVVVPDTVSAGTLFLVEVRTYGNGCNRAGPTESTRDGRYVIVTPFDSQAVGGSVCDDYLNVMEHEVAIQFPDGGPATVRIRGRGRPEGEVKEFDFPVWVR